MALSEIKLGSTLESVEALGQCGTKEFRINMAANILIAEFGAGPSPTSWLDSFKAHELTIESLAVQAFKTSGKSPVLIYKSSQ